MEDFPPYVGTVGRRFHPYPSEGPTHPRSNLQVHALQQQVTQLGEDVFQLAQPVGYGDDAPT